MPAKDLYHDAVVKALTQDGWTITDDPLKLTYGGQKMYVDLGADFFAERFGQFILKQEKLPLIVFDEEQERIVSWITQ